MRSMATTHFIVFLVFIYSTSACWVSSVKFSDAVVRLNDPISISISLNCDTAVSVIAKISYNNDEFEARLWKLENSNFEWIFKFEAFTKGQYEIISLRVNNVSLPISHIQEDNRQFHALSADTSTKRS